VSRIVVKVGSSSLSSATGGLDGERVDALVAALAAARERGDEIVLVSSGAIAAGLAPLGLDKRPRDLATQQAAASVGQGALIARYAEQFALHGLTVGQVLLTADDVTRRAHYRNAYQTLDRLLELGAVPIVNENDTVATSEIRFGDNDRLAALVSHLVRADRLILLSDVDGLYDGNPSQPGTSLVPEVHGPGDLEAYDITRPGASAIGTGGMVTKVEAARIATGAGIPVTLTSAANAAQALEGARIGTLFHATGKRRSVRQLWLAHASDTKGVVRIDAGAVRALTQRGASLLAAGVTGVDGEFSAGDPVDLAGPDGEVVARGIVNFDVEQIPSLMGHSTSELAATLGTEYERAVVHRDDLMLL
jgi:glutamate 5-kinase